MQLVRCNKTSRGLLAADSLRGMHVNKLLSNEQIQMVQSYKATLCVQIKHCLNECRQSLNLPCLNRDTIFAVGNCQASAVSSLSSIDRSFCE